MYYTENVDILVRIKRRLPSMTKVEQKIANYILKNYQLVPNMSVKELANEANVSEAGVIRFCKSIGVDGYKMLKLALVKDIHTAKMNINNVQSIIRIENNNISELFEGISLINKKAIEDTKFTIDKKELENAVVAIMNSNNIVFYGVGGSSPISMDAFNKFMKIGFNAENSTDFHVVTMMVSNLTRGDVLFLVSTSGKTIDIIEAAKIAKDKGATVIALTQFDCKTPLYLLADIKLCIPYLEEDFRIGSMPSRIALLNVIDCLYLAVCNRLGAKAIDKLTENRENIIKMRR
ncbi:MurR/RpiR family transcriptional regulator [Sporanaerobacter acetigenes]|uniref:MurR/RpiR family transcriptional regulator n=1 Tax=Sporanaerobacter acetigenes TaxID=165813 RepID=UPI003325296B